MAAVTKLMHHAVRIGMTDEDVKKAEWFYGQILGLEQDSSRPYVPGIPGAWFNIGPNQIHLIGSPRSGVVEPEVVGDPTIPHVALLVDDIDAMRSQLREAGFETREFNLTGTTQLFVRDPFGNQVEMQQVPD